MVVCGRAGDELCEDFDRESLGFALQGFRDVDFLEHKVEETQISLQGCPPLLRWTSPPRFSVERCGQGEHLRLRVRETSLPRSRDLLRFVQRDLAEAVQARKGRSSPQGRAIYCRRARSTGDAIGRVDGWSQER